MKVFATNINKYVLVLLSLKRVVVELVENRISTNNMSHTGTVSNCK